MINTMNNQIKSLQERLNAVQNHVNKMQEAVELALQLSSDITHFDNLNVVLSIEIKLINSGFLICGTSTRFGIRSGYAMTVSWQEFDQAIGNSLTMAVQYVRDKL